MKTPLKTCLALVTLGFVAVQSAFATNVLLSGSGGTLGYGYGYSGWTNFTSAINSSTGNGVTVVSNYNNLAQMLASDALFLDQRWTSGSLSATELSNLATFIATGKKVVLMGENSGWTSWDNQILGLVGGAYAGDGNGGANTIYSHALTSGVSSVNLPVSGLSTVTGGTALFDQNWATLWGTNQNVLTLLDINVMSNAFWNNADNAQFAQNVADWLGTPSASVPEAGSTVALLGLALVGFAALRRRM